MAILFTNASIITLNETGDTLKNAYLVVEGGKITYVSEAKPGAPCGEVVDCKGGILMPGLVNAHTHSPMSLLRGLRDDCSLDEWLREVIWPIESKLDRKAAHWGTLLSAAEMLAYGTVSFSDMYRYSGSIAHTLAQTGLKANICESITCAPGEDPKNLAQVRESEEMVKEWNGYAGGLIRCDTSIQSVFQTTPDLWDYIAQLAMDEQIGVHIHLSETAAEQEQCLKAYGQTPAAVLARHGVFQNRVVAAHGTFLTSEDIAILKAAEASVVHAPASNLKTCCVTAHLRPFVEAGLNVALGTDGVCSNNSGDLFETMKLTALLQKSYENDPGFMSAGEVLKMAVAGGWAAQGRQGESGVLQPGYDADIILLGDQHPGLMPSSNPVSTAVYSAHGNHVKLTMVRGRVLYKDGEYSTIDMEELRCELKRLSL